MREAGRPEFQREWGAGLELVVQLVVRGAPWIVTGSVEGVSVAGVQKREGAELSRSVVYLQ